MNNRSFSRRALAPVLPNATRSTITHLSKEQEPDSVELLVQRSKFTPTLREVYS
jgi:hypothetical protein